VINKANSIAIPAGFNPRDPATVAAALALLPVNGLDSYSLAQSGGANLIGPALIIEQLAVASGPVIQVVDYNYGLVLPVETFEVASGGFIVNEPEAPPSIEMVIYYDEAAPQTTDSSLSVTGAPYSGSEYATTLFQGEKALFTPSTASSYDGSSWEVALPAADYPLLSRDFTLEAWANVNSNEEPTGFNDVGFGIADENNTEFTEVYFNSDTNNDGSRSTELYFGSTSDSYSALITGGNASSINHFCVQSISGLLYLHMNGEVVHNQVNSLAFSGNQLIFFFVGSADGLGSTLGQIRLTINTAVYGAGSFTPPATAFFDAPE
jgi:hypothetical protein